MSAILHIAGPLGPDQIQRCARCYLPLKDFRHIPRSQPVAWDGGGEYPEGAEVEIGRGYQAMRLMSDPTAQRCRVLDRGSIIDELTYRSYAHNRQLSPQVTPERWQAIYPNALHLEERYQEEGGADD